MSSIKEQLAANIVGYWDFRKGTAVDQSGNGHNGTFINNAGYFANTPKGTAYNSSGGGVLIPSQATLDANIIDKDFSITVAVYIQDWSGTTMCYGGGGANTTHGFLIQNRSNQSMYIELRTPGYNNKQAGVGLKQGFNIITFGWDYSELNFPINSNGINTVSAITTANYTPRQEGGRTFGRRHLTGDFNFEDFILQTIEWNRLLTPEEMSQLYEEILQEAFIGDLPKRNFRLPENVAGNEDNLVGGWNMDIKGSIVYDVVNGNNAVVTGSLMSINGVFGRAVNTNNGTGYLVVPDNADLTFGDGTSDSAFSVEAWIRMEDATNFRIVEKVVDANNREYSLSVSGADKIGFILYDNAFTSYIGVAYDTAITSLEGKWIHVIGTYDGSGIAGGLKLYLNGVDSGDATSDSGDYTAMHNLVAPFNIGRITTTVAKGDIDTVKVYNKELTQTEVTALYQKGAKKLNYRNTFEDAPVTVAASVASGEVGGFKVATGTWKISDDGTDKWLENVTAGIAYIEIPQAFGTFQWDAYHKDGSTTYIMPIANVAGAWNASGQTAYSYSIRNDEVLVLQYYSEGGSATLMATAAGYVANDTKYSFRMTRRYDGTFTLYVKGGAYEVWTQIVIPGGSGTNPVIELSTITSKYFVVDLDAGDKISNIKFWEGVVTPTDLP